MQCSNNLKQLGLAIHNYHDSLNSLPPAVTSFIPQIRAESIGMSGLMALCPYIELTALYEGALSPSWYDGTPATYADGGGWNRILGDDHPYMTDWRSKISGFLCPSDGDAQAASTTQTSKKSYSFCVGDYPAMYGGGGTGTHSDRNRGAFGRYHFNTLGSISDGTSNTIAMAERLGGYATPAKIKVGLAVQASAFNGQALGVPQNCRATVGSSGEYDEDAELMGAHPTAWVVGTPTNSTFSAVLPPNGPSCARINNGYDMTLVTASSNHTGGINALLLDGSVHFVSDTVNTGYLDMTPAGTTSAPTQEGIPSRRSNYGIWGGLGTRNGGESVSL